MPPDRRTIDPWWVPSTRVRHSPAPRFQPCEPPSFIVLSWCEHSRRAHHARRLGLQRSVVAPMVTDRSLPARTSVPGAARSRVHPLEPVSQFNSITRVFGTSLSYSANPTSFAAAPLLPAMLGWKQE